MTTRLSTLAQTKTNETSQRPQLVLEIDGVENRFGLGSIKKYIRIGDEGLEIGNDWVIGGFSDQENQIDAITLDGTTTTIAQQLLQDRGGTSSVSAISLALIDLNGEATRLITPGEIVDDVIGRKANVYLGYQDTAFPQDFIKIFAGVIDEVSAGPTIILNIAHPEQKKRGQIFQKITTELSATVNFRSKVLQGILYKTRRDVVGTVSVAYANTAVAGSETVGVAGNAITIGIQSGVTTNTQVRKAIENDIGPLSLVDIEFTDSTQGPLTVITMGATNLSSDTVLPLVETKGFILPDAPNGLLTYVRIGDEIIQYTGIAGNTLTGCTREVFVNSDPRTFGEYHESGESVESFYRIQGNALDLALKILMSGPNEYFKTGVTLKSINEVEGVGEIQDALYFDGISVEDQYGLIPGDMVTIENDAIPGNNQTLVTIAQVAQTEFGSYILLDGAGLVTQAVSSATLSFKSKWNLWPEGAGLNMGGDEVDVPEFERIRDTFLGAIFEYDFYIRDTMEVKDFIDTKIFFPTGCFTLPRKGKVSVGFTSPPIGSSDLKELDSSNTMEPQNNRIIRGISRYFFNNIVFKYNEDLLEGGKFLSGAVTLDADSKARIPIGNRSFVIEAPGLRLSEANETIIGQLTQRFLDRFKFGAERLKIKAFYGKAFNADVGDIVSFGGADLKLPDSRSGNRNTRVKLWEIVNKSLDIRSGVVTLELVDTAFSITGARFGVVSPSSIVGVGSTTSQIVLVNSYGNEPPRKERIKWEGFFGLKVLIHQENSTGVWTSSEEGIISGFKASDGNVMLIDPPLALAPAAGSVVTIVDYPDNTAEDDQELYKRQFVYANPSIAVVTGTNDLIFEVGVGEGVLFQEGQPVILHSDDSFGIWTLVSNEVKVLSVAGDVITVDQSLGLTPDNTFKIELIGFPDGGFPYRYL